MSLSDRELQADNCIHRGNSELSNNETGQKCSRQVSSDKTQLTSATPSSPRPFQTKKWIAQYCLWWSCERFYHQLHDGYSQTHEKPKSVNGAPVFIYVYNKPIKVRVKFNKPIKVRVKFNKPIKSSFIFSTRFDWLFKSGTSVNHTMTGYI